MALSLSAEGISYLAPGHAEVSLSYRYLHSESIFIGDHEQEQIEKANLGNITDIHSFDVSLSYAFTRRFSATLTLPFTDATGSAIHADFMRHTMHSGGLGDLRLVGNVWAWNPATQPRGNFLLGLGFKAPTGDHNATDLFYRPSGPVLRPVDISIQPGDGGWGMVLEMQGYREFLTNLYGYVAGFYLINPRVKNGTETLRSTPGNIVINSVPDQYLGRLGLSYLIWPRHGLSLSLGARIDGIPTRDLIGGGDDGFRRPGYSIDMEPGLAMSQGRYMFTLSGPVALYRHEEASIRDLQTGTRGAGGFADYLILASVSRRF
jgi:hypothetical protein